jgi:hypothetical protein
MIGDVVGSRRAGDRSALHRLVAATLGKVAGGALDPPAFTLGRLLLAPEIDIRFGIGWGAVTVLDAETGIQDGPGWWTAREAIQHTAKIQRQPGLTLIRTTFRAEQHTRTDTAAVNAALICRDHLIGSLDERSLRIVRGLMTGRTKRELAAAEGISPSAVSQRAARDGLDLVVLASRYLQELW